MKQLPILWQRLVSDAGTTCPRCHTTGDEVRRALKSLRQALEPLGVEPTLQERELDQASFLADPLTSNQILIGGHTIEHWLEGRTGSSRCCDECGDNDCRTIEVGEQVYEAIPEELIVRAGVIAATRLLDPTLSSCVKPAPVTESPFRGVQS